MLDFLTSWLTQHAALAAALGILSLVLLTMTLLATPWLLAKLPKDYFARPPQRITYSPARVLFSTLKTVLGIAVICIGLIMMLTPGPGLVFLVLGLALCEFPGKQQLLIKLVSQQQVFSALNWIRKKADKPPFLRPDSTLGGQA